MLSTVKGIAVCLFLFMCVSSVLTQTALPEFEKYKAKIYEGNLILPKWASQGANGEWRDELGKLIEPPAVNFAGRYYLAVHSCGTGCRNYTLTDLSSGKDLDILGRFDSGEVLPKMPDGRPYLSILNYRSNTRLLIANYLVDMGSGKEQCREQKFVIDKSKVRPLTKIKEGCTSNPN